MPETLWNGIKVPTQTDMWNLVPDLKVLGESSNPVIPVNSQAERDALTGPSGGALRNGTIALRMDLSRSAAAYDVYLNGGWVTSNLPWTPLTLPAGYSANSEAPQVCVINGIVYYRGDIKREAGAYPGYNIDFPAAVPVAARHNSPVKPFTCPGNADLSRKVTINSVGTMTVIGGSSAPLYLSLHSIVYPLQ